MELTIAELNIITAALLTHGQEARRQQESPNKHTRDNWHSDGIRAAALGVKVAHHRALLVSQQMNDAGWCQGSTGGGDKCIIK